MTFTSVHFSLSTPIFTIQSSLFALTLLACNFLARATFTTATINTTGKHDDQHSTNNRENNYQNVTYTK